MKKNIHYIIFIVLCIFVCHLETNALTYGGCEYSEISRLKSLVSNINLSYDYFIENNIAYFDVTINNIVPGIYFVDSQTGITYNYDDSIDGEIVIDSYQNTSGRYNFYSSLSECYGVKLGSKYYTFPTYNNYYDHSICQENKNFSLCQRWVKVTYSYSEFKKIIDEYNEEKISIEEKDEIQPEYKETYFDILVKIYIKYYYFILVGIILICVVIMIVNKKKNSFDL